MTMWLCGCVGSSAERYPWKTKNNLKILQKRAVEFVLGNWVASEELAWRKASVESGDDGFLFQLEMESPVLWLPESQYSISVSQSDVEEGFP